MKFFTVVAFTIVAIAYVSAISEDVAANEDAAACNSVKQSAVTAILNKIKTQIREMQAALNSTGGNVSKTLEKGVKVITENGKLLISNVSPYLRSVLTSHIDTFEKTILSLIPGLSNPFVQPFVQPIIHKILTTFGSFIDKLVNNKCEDIHSTTTTLSMSDGIELEMLNYKSTTPIPY